MRDSVCLSPGPDNFYAHVGPQHFGDDDAAVLLLVVFDNRHPGAAHRQAAAVQSVDVLRLLSGLITDAGAAGLEGFEVGAGGDLLVAVLAGKPDLDVVGLG